MKSQKPRYSLFLSVVSCEAVLVSVVTQVYTTEDVF